MAVSRREMWRLVFLPLACGWVSPRGFVRRAVARHFEPPREWGYFDISEVMERKELFFDNPNYVPDLNYTGTMHPGTVGEERFGYAMDNAPWDDLAVDYETGEISDELWIDDHAFFQMPFYFRFPPSRPWEPSPADRLPPPPYITGVAGKNPEGFYLEPYFSVFFRDFPRNSQDRKGGGLFG